MQPGGQGDFLDRQTMLVGQHGRSFHHALDMEISIGLYQCFYPGGDNIQGFG
jgi:hypothetical protein